MRTELAGFCGVDSGQLILVDPCYAFLDDYEGRETNPSGGNYDAICRVSLTALIIIKECITWIHQY
jgi:hypothetical protein